MIEDDRIGRSVKICSRARGPGEALMEDTFSWKKHPNVSARSSGDICWGGDDQIHPWGL